MDAEQGPKRVRESSRRRANERSPRARVFPARAGAQVRFRFRFRTGVGSGIATAERAGIAGARRCWVSKQKILLVDDERLIQRMTRFILERSQYEVHSAEDG